VQQIVAPPQKDADSRLGGRLSSQFIYAYPVTKAGTGEQRLRNRLVAGHCR